MQLSIRKLLLVCKNIISNLRSLTQPLIQSTVPEDNSLSWAQHTGLLGLIHVSVISCQVSWVLNSLEKGRGSAKMTYLCAMLSLISQIGLFTYQLQGSKRQREGRHQCVSIFQISTCITLELSYGPNQITWSSLEFQCEGNDARMWIYGVLNKLGINTLTIYHKFQSNTSLLKKDTRNWIHEFHPI